MAILGNFNRIIEKAYAVFREVVDNQGVLIVVDDEEVPNRVGIGCPYHENSFWECFLSSIYR